MFQPDLQRLICGIVALILAVALAGCNKSNENQAPEAPSSPVPENGATGQDTTVNLSWSCSDPDGDPLSFGVYFGTSSAPPFIANTTSFGYDPGALEFGRTYFWRIVAGDNQGHSASGPVWSFSAEYSANQAPPYAPSNPIPSPGAQNIALDGRLSWVGCDPNGDPMTYDVYFGATASPTLVSPLQADTTYQPASMDSGSTYYWKIVAHDNHGNSTSGPLWSFATLGTAPSSGKITDFGNLPRWSPNGQKLVFGADGANLGIWVWDRGSATVTQITDDSYPHLYDYSWSPGSDQIAFGGAGASIENKSGIFVANLDGSAPVRWHETGHSPSWLKDNSGLVFAEDDPQAGAYGLYKLIFADTSLTQLTSGGTDPQVAPTGTFIAYREPAGGGVATYKLKIMALSGGSASILADTCTHFCWTADGGTLVFDYLVTGGQAIKRVSLTGGAITTIILGATEPSIAYTGRIAYQGVSGDLSTGIHIINIDGSGGQFLSNEGYQPSISPDGSSVAYAREDGIYLVNP